MDPAPRRFGPSGHPFKQLQEGCVGRQRLLVTDKVLVTARERRAGAWGWGSPVTFLTVWSGPEGERGPGGDVRETCVCANRAG